MWIKRINWRQQYLYEQRQQQQQRSTSIQVCRCRVKKWLSSVGFYSFALHWAAPRMSNAVAVASLLMKPSVANWHAPNRASHQKLTILHFLSWVFAVCDVRVFRIIILISGLCFVLRCTYMEVPTSGEQAQRIMATGWEWFEKGGVLPHSVRNIIHWTAFETETSVGGCIFIEK